MLKLGKFPINNKLWELIIFGFVLSIIFVSFRHLLIGSDDYQLIGRNWDWSFPVMKHLFSRIGSDSFYIWSIFDMGAQKDLVIALLLANTFIANLSLLFSTKSVIIITLALVNIISFLSFKKLLNYIFGKSVINNIPALLFAFSPFLLNEIIGGSWYMWVSYAFSPLFFLSLSKYINSGCTKQLLIFLISALLVFSSLQNFVILEVIFIVFYFLLNLSIQKRKNIKPEFLMILKRYVLAHIFFIMISAYWILPFIFLLNNFEKVVWGGEFVGNFMAVRNNTQTILNILSLNGYLDRNFYQYITSFGGILSLPIFFAWAGIIYSLKFRRNKIESKLKIVASLFFIILIFTLLIIKSGNNPFPELTIFIFENFPLMNLYRSPQHLMFAAAFIIPILFSFSLHFFYKNIKHSGLVIFIFTLISISWISGWWISGDIGHKSLKKQKRDFVDFYNLSPELIKIYNLNEILSLNHRVIFLPSVFSPKYLENEYQNAAQGGQSEYLYLKNSTFRSETNIFANNIDNKFCFNEELDLIEYLSLTNTRYVSVRSDILPKFTKCGELKSVLWNDDMVKRKLNIEKGVNLLFAEKYASLYMVKNEFFLPHFYTTKNSIISHRTIDELPKIISSYDWQTRSAVFFAEQNVGRNVALEELKNDATIDSNLDNALPTLEFKKINPTKYRVRVHGASGVFPLVFSESFHDGWKSYLVKQGVDSLPTSRQAATHSNDTLGDYKILDGNFEDQATRDELQNYIDSGFVTTLGDGKEKTIKHKKWENNQEKLDYVEKYQIDFVSKNFQGTIQNDNLPNGNIFETWLKKPIENNANHLMANGYANSWVVDTNEICNPAPSSPQPSPRAGEGAIECVKNPDGSYDFEMIVEFWPQRLFYVGLAISGLTLLGCVGYLGYDWRRRKKLDPKIG